MRRIAFISFAVHVTLAMLIPDDTEMLDGYAAAISLPEISPEDDYYEARSLSESMLYNSIRNKRDAQYEVHESEGLPSHFRPNSVNAFRTIHAERTNAESDGRTSLNRRERRATDTNAGTENTNKTTNDDGQNKTKIELPTALRRVMKSGGFFPDTKSASAAALVSKWTRTPFEYSKIQHEEDSMAMDSTQAQSMNDGIKARTPRVNFVTQPKKMDSNSGSNDDDSKSSATKPEFYNNKSPPLIHDSKDSTSVRTSERTPSRPISYPDYYRERDPEKYYMHHYDDRYMDDGNGMPPPPPSMPLYGHDMMPEYRRHYDAYDQYMPRMPSYPEQYYDYPDSRYDVPDYRDYPPMHGNDVDDRYYTPSDMAPPPPQSARRRIIYYAHLPEVVRNPPSTADARYRYYDRYDDPYYDYYAPPPPPYNPLLTSYRNQLPMRPYVRPENEYHAASSARPIKTNETTRSGKVDKRFDANGKFIVDKGSTRTHTYRSDYY